MCLIAGTSLQLGNKDIPRQQFPIEVFTCFLHEPIELPSTRAHEHRINFIPGVQCPLTVHVLDVLHVHHANVDPSGQLGGTHEPRWLGICQGQAALLEQNAALRVHQRGFILGQPVNIQGAVRIGVQLWPSKEKHR